MHVGRAREFCQRHARIPAFFADHRQDRYQPFPGTGRQQNDFAIGFKHLQIGGDPLRTVKRRASRLVAQLLPSVSQKVNYFGPAGMDFSGKFHFHGNVDGHLISKGDNLTCLPERGRNALAAQLNAVARGF